MTKTQVQNAIKDLERVIKKWKSRLFLQDWHFEFCPAQQSRDDHASLAVDANPTYLQAQIFIFPEFFKVKRRERDLELMVVHELLHCVESEFIGLFEELENGRNVTRKQKIDAVERMTQRLARSFLRRK